METAAELPDDLPQRLGVFFDDPACLLRPRRLGFEVCSPVGGSSDWLMVERFKPNP
jgi:hypothetical protein